MLAGSTRSIRPVTAGLEEPVQGGAPAPLIISATDRLAENEIRGATLPCDLAIPSLTSGPIDFGRVNVHVQGRLRFDCKSRVFE